MSWAKFSRSSRRMILSGTVMAVAAIALILGSQGNAVEAQGDTRSELGSTTFPGTNTGAIPDGLTGTPPQFGAPRVVSFAVTGATGAITAMSADFTATHTWVGDVDVVLAAPGGSPSLVLVSRIGVTTAGSFGDSSNYAGAYSFADTAAGANIWTAAGGVCGDTCNVAVGSYRTTGAGATGQTNPPPVTSLVTTFGSLTPAQINGTWTMSFRDGANLDTGTVTAANLTLDAGGTVVTPQNVIDYNGDGRTDFSVVRNTGGGASGQITWFNSLNGPGTVSGAQWGLASDFFVPNDYDGDNRTDIAVWRPGAAGTAAFYILRSSNATLQFELFGQTGDDPTVVGDYDGDGRADAAVYRSGASAGQQSTWFYRGSLSNPSGNVTFVPWGQNGDFVAPGDYDGDGRADFVIQRNNGGGQARFWFLQTTAGATSIVFGTPTDVVLPGDYDADGRTDLAVVRGSGGFINWFVRPSSTGVISAAPYAIFGNSATDLPTQGDYDGDGRTDVAVWRPNADPTQNFFFFLGSTAGFAQSEWGQNGDYPVANYNSH